MTILIVFLAGSAFGLLVSKIGQVTEVSWLESSGVVIVALTIFAVLVLASGGESQIEAQDWWRSGR
jgi:hypothetical protein